MANARKPDFSGWVTKNDILCSDGRIIRSDAFAHQDGVKVPGCWNHQHNDPSSVWGHVILHSVEGGVRGDAYVNNTDSGRQAKALVKNGDITNFSIYANRVKQRGKDVVHGTITEVSLVFAGANPGAKIDDILEHSAEDGDSMIFYTDDDNTLFFHADEEMGAQNFSQQVPAQNVEGGTQPMSLEAVLRTMNDQQKLAVLQMVNMAIDKGAASAADAVTPIVQHAIEERDAYAAALDMAATDNYTLANACETLAHADDPVPGQLNPQGQNFNAAQNRIRNAQASRTVSDVIASLTPEKKQVAQLIQQFAMAPQDQKDPSVFADPNTAAALNSLTSEEVQAILATIGAMMQGG